MEAERGSSGWSAGTRLLVRYEDDPRYWHERLVVQRVFNDGGWIIYTPHGDLYFEDYDCWAEALEREGPRYDRVPARVSESGDFLVSFGEPIGGVAFDALAIDACEVAQPRCPSGFATGTAPFETPLALWRPLQAVCGGWWEEHLNTDLAKENVDLTRCEALDANWRWSRLRARP